MSELGESMPMATTAEPKPYYEPATPFSEQRSELRAEIGRRVGEKLDGTVGLSRIATGSSRPVQLYVRDAFLEADECEALCGRIDSNIFPSLVYDREKHEGLRTSYSCDLDPYDPIVAEVNGRIAGLLGIDPAWGELLQGQRYETGQQFTDHTDFCYVDQPYWPEYEARGGQRTWTAMIYLRVPEEGGSTAFRFLDFSVTPKLGRLAIWNNMALDGSPNPWTEHSGRRVERGTKYIVTKWYRERPFV
jgi:prolyl 4-hydroxylase